MQQEFDIQKYLRNNPLTNSGNNLLLKENKYQKFLKDLFPIDISLEHHQIFGYDDEEEFEAALGFGEITDEMILAKVKEWVRTGGIDEEFEIPEGNIEMDKYGNTGDFVITISSDDTEEGVEFKLKDDLSDRIEEGKIHEGYLTEEINLEKIQTLFDGNQFLKGTKVKEEDLIIGDKYILFAPEESLGHIKTRHQDANAPGSLITAGNLKDIVTKVLSTKGVPKGGMVRWLDVKVGDVGEMGVAWGEKEEVDKMKDYTMPDGRKEKVKVSAGKREKTDLFNLITAEIGKEDGKELLSLVTAFPGGSKVDGKEIPADRSKFAAQGFYFVVPETSPALKENQKIMKEFNFREFLKDNPLTKETHLIKKSELKQIIKEEVQKTLYGIEEMGKSAALEIKMQAIDEEIGKRKRQLEMIDENNGLSELMDKKKLKELQKEIKLLEKQHGKYNKIYEKEVASQANKKTGEEPDEIVEGEEDDEGMKKGDVGSKEKDEKKEKTAWDPNPYTSYWNKVDLMGPTPSRYYNTSPIVDEDDKGNSKKEVKEGEEFGIATPELDWGDHRNFMKPDEADLEDVGDTGDGWLDSHKTHRPTHDDIGIDSPEFEGEFEEDPYKSFEDDEEGDEFSGPDPRRGSTIQGRGFERRGKEDDEGWMEFDDDLDPAGGRGLRSHI